MFPVITSRRGFFDDLFPRLEVSTASRCAVKESEDFVKILISAPGRESKDFDIEVGEGILTIKSKKDDDKKTDRDIPWIASEIEMSFRLSNKLDENSLAAECRNGVLSLTLPKKPERKPTKICVS